MKQEDRKIGKAEGRMVEKLNGWVAGKPRGRATAARQSHRETVFIHRRLCRGEAAPERSWIRSSVLRLFGSSAFPLFLLFSILLLTVNAHAGPAKDISSILKENDACLLTDPEGKELVSVHPNALLIPASTLKVFTALVGFHYLGPEYRFPTEVYLSETGDLTVKGYGDPLLISEVIEELAEKIHGRLPGGNPVIRNIILDDTYFASPLTIPGVSDSDEPYDAPNGALCANFNTVSFQRVTDGGYVSGETQTPLLPTVLDRVRRSGLSEGRIPLSHKRVETTGYTGHLLKYFLNETGVTVTGDVRFAPVDKTRNAIILTFHSPYPLSEVVSKLLEFSNNFTANQILIAAGAKAYGPPGTLENGLRAAEAFAAEHLALQSVRVFEGSGISRKNRMTARMMLLALKAFEPYHALMQHNDHTYYKTGTLNGIATRVGYIVDSKGDRYPFVVMLNGSEKKMQKVMDSLSQKVLTP